MDSSLDGRVAIVTGATRTMGVTIAGRLAQLGTAIVAVGRDAVAGNEVADRIRDDGGVCDFERADLARPDDVQAAVDGTVRRHGRVDIVVNNAAATDLLRQGGDGNVVDLSLEDFDRHLKVNLYGPFLLAKHTIPHMLSAGRGSIVSISSINSTRSAPGLSGYAASKAGLEALTRQIANDFGDRGIRANSVLVGAIRTPETEREHDAGDQGGRRNLLWMLPRAGTADDVASMVAFLTSDDAAFVTGAVIPLDGGALGKFSVGSVIDRR